MGPGRVPACLSANSAPVCPSAPFSPHISPHFLSLPLAFLCQLLARLARTVGPRGLSLLPGVVQENPGEWPGSALLPVGLLLWEQLTTHLAARPTPCPEGVWTVRLAPPMRPWGHRGARPVCPRKGEAVSGQVALASHQSSKGTSGK